MKRHHLPLTILLAIISFALPATAMEKPTWMSKGVKELNNARSNDSYTFSILNTHNTDLTRLVENRDKALTDYVVDTYGATPASVNTTKLPGDTCTYRVQFTSADNTPHTITACLVDTYYELDDYVETYFEFEYYQLYAISRPDVAPHFDEFSIRRTSNSKAATMSLIPGLGQIYKGQEVSGYLFMGGEIVLVGAAVIFEVKRHDCWNKSFEPSVGQDSYRKKSRSWRTFRNLTIGAAAALYIGNLLDAAYSQGSPQVVVGKRGGSLTVLPYIDTDASGLALSLTF